MVKKHKKIAKVKPQREDYIIVLDLLPNGYSFDTRPDYMKTPIVQAVGKEHLGYLEMVPKKGVIINQLEEVYIGEGKREQIHHLVGLIDYKKLTSKSKANLKRAFEFSSCEEILSKLIPKLPGLTIVESFESHGNHRIVLNYQIPSHDRDFFVNKIREIKQKEVDIRSQIGMSMEGRIIRGRNFKVS